MKKRMLFACLLLLFVVSCKKSNNGGGDPNPDPDPDPTPVGNKPAFSWSKKFKNITVYGITTDADDNIYMAGATSNTTDLGGGAVNGKNMFIAKYKGSGDFIWQKIYSPAPGFSEAGFMKDLVVDSKGNIIAAGLLTQSASLDGVNNELSTNGRTAPFVIKLDKDGKYIWHRMYPAGVFSGVGDIIIDDNNSVVLSGHFSGVLNDRVSKGKIDAFVAGLDENGHDTFTKAYGRSNDDNDDYAPFMQRGKDKLFYITRSFKDEIRGDMFFTAAGNNFNTYYFNSDATGQVPLAGKVGDVSGSVNSWSITAAATGDVFLAGNFSQTVDFGDGAVTTSVVNPFILSVNNKGAFKWKKVFGAGVFAENTHITWLNNDLLIAGYTGFYNTSGTSIQLGGETIDTRKPKVYWVCYDTSGNYKWEILFDGSESGSYCKDICVDSKGHIIAAGNFVLPGESTANVDYILVKY
ncbi:MAG: hypothetical protein QM664_02805 [Flavihumibacter sp.]